MKRKILSVIGGLLAFLVVSTSMAGHQTPTMWISPVSYINHTLVDDVELRLGSSSDAKFTWETADANANLLLLTLPEASAVNVSGLVVGDRSADGLDLTLFDGEDHPFIGILSDDHQEAIWFAHTGADAIFKTSLGDIFFAPASGDVNIGNSSVGGGDLFFNTPSDGAAKFSYREGNSGVSEVYTAFSGNFDQYGYFLGDTAGRQIVIADVAGRNVDYDHAVRTNPHMYPHSFISATITNNQYGDLYHDQENFVISAGANVGTGTVPTTDNNGILVAPLSLTSGGTDNFGLSVTRTLNDTGAAGGTDVYDHIHSDLTETDITGWDEVNLVNLKVGGTTQILIEDDGNLTTTGGQKVNRTAISDAAYTALPNDYIIAYTAITAERIVTLPVAATAGAATVYIIVDESGNAGAFNIVIDGNGAEEISGALTQTISVAYDSVSLYCNGTDWFKF